MKCFESVCDRMVWVFWCYKTVLLVCCGREKVFVMWIARTLLLFRIVLNKSNGS